MWGEGLAGIEPAFFYLRGMWLGYPDSMDVQRLSVVTNRYISSVF